MANGFLKRIAYRAFQDIDSYLTDLYQVYVESYPSIPTICYEQNLQDKHAFDYCLKRRYYVLVIPYTKERRILLERSFANNRLTWVCIGGSLRNDLMETFIDAANRHASKTMVNLELGEIEPIAFLKNRFVYKEQEHLHEGIAFVARIRNRDPAQDLKNAVHSRGHFVPYDDASIEISLQHNANVINLARSYLKETDTESAPEFEISENIRYKYRYYLHDAFVKRFFKLWGRPIFKHSIQELDNKVMSLLQDGGHEKILDVACGENTSVVKFAKLPDVQLVIGNDVSWSQISLMSARFGNDAFRDIGSFILFTNHDARRLPFPDGYFDFVLCKNVLHHMDDLGSVENLIKEVLRVGKRSLIVEIMDPKYESLWGRLRHHYYIHYLHDAGHHFLDRKEFASLVKFMPNCRTFEMKTIRGIYQFAFSVQKEQLQPYLLQ